MNEWMNLLLEKSDFELPLNPGGFWESSWDGDVGISGLSLVIKKVGKQKIKVRINSDNKYSNTLSLNSSVSILFFMNIKFHKNPTRAPDEKDKQHIVQITVRISSLNQLAAIFPGELSKIGWNKQAIICPI